MFNDESSIDTFAESINIKTNACDNCHKKVLYAMMLIIENKMHRSIPMSAMSSFFYSMYNAKSNEKERSKIKRLCIIIGKKA